MTSESGLAILVWAADPGRPELCATPFYFAAAAAAMDAEVEMFFTAGSVRLLEVGVAETLRAAPGGRTVAEFLGDAASFGVRFFACPTALDAHGVDAARLRPETTGRAGAPAYLARVLGDGWKSLVF